MQINVGRRCRGAHERHVVERGHEHPAVRHMEVEILPEVIIVRGSRCGAAHWRRRGESIFGAGTKLLDAPRNAMTRESGFDPLSIAGSEGDHVLKGVIREHMLEGGAHRCGRQDITGERASDSSDIHEVGIGIAGNRCCHLPGDSVGAAGNAAPDALADDEDVRFEAPRLGASAGTG